MTQGWTDKDDAAVNRYIHDILNGPPVSQSDTVPAAIYSALLRANDRHCDEIAALCQEQGRLVRQRNRLRAWICVLACAAGFFGSLVIGAIVGSF
jgi:hypothetical protein